MDMLFLRPSTQEEALALLTQYKQDAMIVAGGTDAVLRLTQKKTAICFARIWRKTLCTKNWNIPENLIFPVK